jgi:hypothetical protein
VLPQRAIRAARVRESCPPFGNICALKEEEVLKRSQDERYRSGGRGLAFQHTDRRPDTHGLWPVAGLIDFLRPSKLVECSKVMHHRVLETCQWVLLVSGAQSPTLNPPTIASLPAICLTCGTLSIRQSVRWYLSPAPSCSPLRPMS